MLEEERAVKNFRELWTCRGGRGGGGAAAAWVLQPANEQSSKPTSSTWTPISLGQPESRARCCGRLVWTFDACASQCCAWTAIYTPDCSSTWITRSWQLHGVQPQVFQL
jgi:hypothetical protein